ncbi:RNA pseudouridine synthase [Acinetobacter qingfengensis]|uniref:RNA pseudouridine synthase n=1 Tax=Acinetobacter qingfengensis TaxID=1262585 RepID=A0A1E7RFM9_9GAMM|nr:pseudouridine synthase [Acinetobacter qingfengensis]KAA8732792.1 RNA pseudouridine synthase [Acinetobacter qingfengensis]OEY98096.1 RNA pseudouridine synthase [Acinetobacter qingfengensis]
MSEQQQPFIYRPPQQALEILFEDDDLVIINKPVGLLSVPGRLPEHYDSCYTRILKLYPTAKVTHRLDMATSGILMFAKHRDAEVAVSKMFQKKNIEKHYLALVEGQLSGVGDVEAPIMTDWPNRPKQKIDFIEGKAAKTLYYSMGFDGQHQISRIRLIPITGRSHQLRLHMAYIGHPITGDKLYHPEPQRSMLNRMALHASYLALQHPLRHNRLEIISAPEF